MLKKAA